MHERYTHQRRPVVPPKIGLAALRRCSGLTQAEVAQQVAAKIEKPFYSGALSNIEKGHRGASAEVLAALEQVFKLAPGELEVEYEPSHDRRPKLSAVGAEQ